MEIKEHIKRCIKAEDVWAEETTNANAALAILQNRDFVKISDDEVKMPKLWYDGIVERLEKAEEENKKLLTLLNNIRFQGL